MVTLTPSCVTGVSISSKQAASVAKEHWVREVGELQSKPVSDRAPNANSKTKNTDRPVELLKPKIDIILSMLSKTTKLIKRLIHF